MLDEDLSPARGDEIAVAERLYAMVGNWLDVAVSLMRSRNRHKAHAESAERERDAILDWTEDHADDCCVFQTESGEWAAMASATSEDAMRLVYAATRREAIRKAAGLEAE